MAVLRQHCIHTARQDAIRLNKKPVWQYSVRIVSILHGRIAFCRKWLPVIQYCSNTASILRGRMPVWQHYINIVSILGVRSRIMSGWSMLSQYCVRTKLLLGLSSMDLNFMNSSYLRRPFLSGASYFQFSALWKIGINQGFFLKFQ